jgi:hypothetical protein
MPSHRDLDAKGLPQLIQVPGNERHFIAFQDPEMTSRDVL